MVGMEAMSAAASPFCQLQREPRAGKLVPPSTSLPRFPQNRLALRSGGSLHLVVAVRYRSHKAGPGRITRINTYACRYP